MTSGQITVWLERLRSGDDSALDELFPLVYRELRGLAGSQLRGEQSDHTLSATALVHEAYVRLAQQRKINAGDRLQFLSIAGNTMRRVLVDWARTKKRAKRGGGKKPLPLDDVEQLLSAEQSEEVLALDAALERLGAANPRAAAIVEHRFFAGLTLDETATLLGISRKTAGRDWAAARAWLKKEIDRDLA